MHRVSLKIATAICTLLAVGYGTAAYGQNYDGQWNGTYACGQHTLKSDFGPFTWRTLSFSVQNGVVSGRHDYVTRAGVPTTAAFAGHIDQNGTIGLGVTARQEDGGEDFHQSLTGRAGSSRSAELAGTMLNHKGTAVRDCRLTLTLAAPAPYSLAGVEVARQQQAAAAAAQAERLAAAEREHTKALDRQRAAETAQQQAEAEQKPDAERQHLLADLEAAKQSAAKAEQQIADLKAAQDQAAKEQMADAQRQHDETEHLRAETEQLAAAQQAQAQTESNHADAIVAFLKDMQLRDSTQLKEWIARHPAIPVQQQQFCLIVKKFGPDLSQIKQANNEIRENILYRDRQQDFEALLPRGRFENWIVQIESVTQAADGSAAITLQPPCHVMLGSDACQKNGSKIRATIQPDTPLFREAAKVGRGDFVVVSGTILYAAHEGQTQALPQYATYKTGEYCANTDGQDVFVTDVDYLVQLR